MTIVRPTGVVRREAAQALTLPEAGVAEVVVDLSVGSAHDRVELVLWHESALAGAEPGERVTVALGDAGDDEDVLTAEVAGVARAGAGALLSAYAPSRRLSSTRVARSYLRQTVADVVGDLLDAGGVDAGTLEAPQELPALHVDGARPAWQHVHRLAALVGAQVTSDPDGAVSVAPAPGASPSGGLGGAVGAAAGALGLGGGAELRPGANVLEWRVGPRRAEPEATRAVVALGAASRLGAERWYHLEPEPEGTSDPVTVAALARDRDVAGVATTARSDAARRRAVSGRVRVPGDPALRAGGTVTLESTSYRVLSVRHRVSRDAGYTCDVVLEGT